MKPLTCVMYELSFFILVKMKIALIENSARHSWWRIFCLVTAKLSKFRFRGALSNIICLGIFFSLTCREFEILRLSLSTSHNIMIILSLRAIWLVCNSSREKAIKHSSSYRLLLFMSRFRVHIRSPCPWKTQLTPYNICQNCLPSRLGFGRCVFYPWLRAKLRKVLVVSVLPYAQSNVIYMVSGVFGIDNWLDSSMLRILLWHPCKTTF